ncbi:MULTISPECIES: integrase [unclassified Streptomyces]|uniref:integrase n=1 Tax=unclassified Streptomyces TaxID=2593676 RepID=UPI0037B619AE
MFQRPRKGTQTAGLEPWYAWLYSGVDPAECARRAGQSIEVLFRHYAKFLDGLREQANRLIEQSMDEWQRVSQGDVPEG